MADKSLTAKQVTFDEMTGDLYTVTANNSVTIGASDTAIIKPTYDRSLVLTFLASGAAASVKLMDGDSEVSPNAGLGDKAFAVPSGDMVIVFPDPAKHLKSDGTIEVETSSTTIVGAVERKVGL